jgi:hypothetical protein
LEQGIARVKNTFIRVRVAANPGER